MEAQLKNDIKNKTFKNVYVFTGDEKYLADYYSKEICSALVDEDMKEFNFLKLSTLPSPEDIDAFASSYPFMSEHKVMLVKDTGIMKSAPEDIKEYFTELLSCLGIIGFSLYYSGYAYIIYSLFIKRKKDELTSLLFSAILIFAVLQSMS